MKNKLYFAKVKPNAIIPSKREEDGGYDLYACFEEDFIRIDPNEIKLIPTGVACAFDKDYVMLLRERGSTGTKGLSLRAGIIDSGYRNEIFVPINNTTTKIIYIAKNKESVIKEERKLMYDINITEETVLQYCTIYPYEKAIAQAVMVINPKLDVEELDYEELKQIESERGLGKLGSSGK